MSANRQHPASAAVAELRQALTPLLRLYFEDLQSRRLLELFTLLRRLQPEDVQTAMLCHRVLLRVARENLEQMGFIDDEWAILPRLVHNVIEAHGYDFCRRGRWELKEYGGWARPASLELVTTPDGREAANAQATT